MDSFINGAFYGWSGESLFKLGHNQYWIQARYAYRYRYSYRPKARIVEEGGTYYLEVEGMNDRINVRRVRDVIESQIDDAFEGWSGDTKFKLANGQVWQQDEYNYMYHYAYRPNVIVYASQSGYRIKVDGVQQSIRVKRIQ
ncbi:hypothetical protein [Paenibacillus lautus]|uniref:hypothetical protein n=1 Tax=Paenibacillus lautus TaxID=1401 RepID=UPI003D2C9D74